MTITLHGYRYSVYAWIARFALVEKGVAFGWSEVNPFAPDRPAEYLELHPFGRVPTLVEDGFVLYETGAITRYVNEAFPGPALQPGAARERAKVNQIVSAVDSYVYWPLVRQVFAHGVMGPRINRPADPEEVRRGMEAAPRILQALEGLAGGGRYLIGESLTLADIHLGPMIFYFQEAAEGRALLQRYPKLAAWLTALTARNGFIETRPQLPPPKTPC